MKLALIIDDYLPDSTRVGAKMFHELAVQLVQQGHQITVITPVPDPSYIVKCESIDGVDIWRFRSGKIKDVSKAKRAMNETMLSFRAWSAIKDKVKENTFDGVVYYSPSIFWGYLVYKIKERCSCPSYLVLRDMFPQWVIDAGMLRSGSLLHRYFRFFENYSYKQADCIGLMSDKNLQEFSDANPVYSCEVLRNWACLEAYVPKNGQCSTIREKFSLQNKIIFFYGGNIGHAQDMSNLMRLVRSMQKHRDAHFLFVGQGDEVELINRLANDWELKNFTYLPSVSQGEFKEILSEVDIGLFSLSANHTSHNFPGKLLGYMVQSLPILGSVNSGNDLLDVVNSNNAGFIHVNGDDSALLQSAEKLLLQKELRSSTGRYANELLIEQFSVHSAAQAIEKRFEVGNATT